ncbi:MAG: A-type flagellin [Pseudomonadota bacterium]|jgi:flagellin
MTVINTNIKGLYTQAALKLSERAGQVAMEQLSTGKRINSAKDDAAGMAIAARMTQQIRGLNQASRNAGDAISFIQTIEGATNEITNMLQRMSELAVQAANDTYSNEQRGFLDLEFQQLKTEIVRISEKYNWNGFKIMDGTAGAPIGPQAVTLTNPTGTLSSNELLINGTAIRAPLASDDPFSDTTASSSLKEKSAIALAEAINEKQSLTGVRASATGPVTNGTLTTIGTETGPKDLFVNGVQIPIRMDTADTPAERRAKVVTAINNSVRAGATASDNGTGGVTVTTKDGRNLSIWFDDSLEAANFGLGMTRSAGLEAATGASTVGDVTQTNVAAISESQDIVFTLPADGTVLTFTFDDSGGGLSTATYTVDYDLDIDLPTFVDNLEDALRSEANYDASIFTITSDGIEKLTVAWEGATDYTNYAPTLVTVAGATYATPTSTNGADAYTADQVDITFDTLPSEGETISITAAGVTVTYLVQSTDVDQATLLASLAAELDADADFAANVDASEDGTTLTLTGMAADDDLSDVTVDIYTTATAGVKAIANALASSTTAATLYGTVTLRSDTDHIIVTSSSGDLDDLPVTVGDTDQAGDPVRQYAGRMSFQVGPIADQIITIDMYDWGKNGALTGEVTGDVDRAIPKVNVRTVADANAVIDKLTRVMDNVNAKRADMGAVMNRLEHVIDNLNVVSRNAEASRSQIEDADYAKASTELARTQIMQQAATAVLAQANASQQSVLKLLQG